MLLARYVSEGALQIEVSFIRNDTYGCCCRDIVIGEQENRGRSYNFSWNLESGGNIGKIYFTYHHIYKLKSEDFSISVSICFIFGG